MVTSSADKPDPPQANCGAPKPASYVPSYPFADALFKAIGEQLDAVEAEREYFATKFARDIVRPCVVRHGDDHELRQNKRGRNVIH